MVPQLLVLEEPFGLLRLPHSPPQCSLLAPCLILRREEQSIQPTRHVPGMQFHSDQLRLCPVVGAKLVLQVEGIVELEAMHLDGGILVEEKRSDEVHAHAIHVDRPAFLDASVLAGRRGQDLVAEEHRTKKRLWENWGTVPQRQSVANAAL
eukprot:scaffold922_cov327-Pinguiococcus_pyrenoidosus.AAC.10